MHSKMSLHKKLKDLGYMTKEAQENGFFYPYTLDLSDRIDCRKFFEEKPTSMRLIKIDADSPASSSSTAILTKELEQQLYETLQGGMLCDTAPELPKILIQSYVENPLLHEGRKMDFRIYMLVTSLSPASAILIPGFARISPTAYSLASVLPSTHLTNLNRSPSGGSTLILESVDSSYVKWPSLASLLPLLPSALPSSPVQMLFAVDYGITDLGALYLMEFNAFPQWNHGQTHKMKIYDSVAKAWAIEASRRVRQLRREAHFEEIDL